MGTYFHDQGGNSHALYWKVDSQPVDLQEIPQYLLYYFFCCCCLFLIFISTYFLKADGFVGLDDSVMKIFTGDSVTATKMDPRGRSQPKLTFDDSL